MVLLIILYITFVICISYLLCVFRLQNSKPNPKNTPFYDYQ